MIRNILFDMGNVLMRFSPPKLIGKYTEDPADAALLLREVFHETEWIALDHGTMNEDEAVSSVCQRLPSRLHPAAKGLICDWWKDPFEDVEGMEELIVSLHENGYHLYLLSNASLRQTEYCVRLPGWQYFEGRITSAEVKLLKPQKEIFELCLKKFSLSAEECVFIDDSAANVYAASFAGISGIVFHDDVSLLKQRMKEKGIHIE